MPWTNTWAIRTGWLRRVQVRLFSRRSWSRTNTEAASSLSRQLKAAKEQVAEKRAFFEGCSNVLRAYVREWEMESTKPQLVNGEWESVYKPRVLKRACDALYTVCSTDWLYSSPHTDKCI
jgi:hypothetical protein